MKVNFEIYVDSISLHRIRFTDLTWEEFNTIMLSEFDSMSLAKDSRKTLHYGENETLVVMAFRSYDGQHDPWRLKLVNFLRSLERSEKTVV